MDNDNDNDDAPMPSHVNSARAAHDEMERRRRKRERNLQAPRVAGTMDYPKSRDSADVVAGTVLPTTRAYSLRAGTGKYEITGNAATLRYSGVNLRQTLTAVSSVAPTAQQTSIKNLEPLFRKLTDTEVNVYAMDEQPIGARIGVQDVPEPTLKAIASFEVQRRGRVSDRTWYVVGGLLLAVATGVGAWIVAKMTGG